MCSYEMIDSVNASKLIIVKWNRMSLAQLLLLRQGGASGTLPLEETCLEMEIGSILALSRLIPGQDW